MIAITGRFFRAQTGMVLLLCLIFLTALTLLGLSVSADNILQSQLNANLQDTERARQSAQKTLSWAEDWLLGLDSPAPKPCTAPCEGLNLHSAGDLPPGPEWESLSWWKENGHEAGINPLTGGQITKITWGSAGPPVWIIEAMHSIPPAMSETGHLQVWYRLLSRANGRSDAVVSVVESTVVRSWVPGESPNVPGHGVSGPCPGPGLSTYCRRVSWRELR